MEEDWREESWQHQHIFKGATSRATVRMVEEAAVDVEDPVTVVAMVSWGKNLNFFTKTQFRWRRWWPVQVLQL